MAVTAGAWNLTELFSSPKDPKIEVAIQEAEAQAEHFQSYRGKMPEVRERRGVEEC